MELIYMNYQDTVEQAERKLQKTLVFLKQHRLAANPINYGVAYEYVSQQNKQIKQQIEADIQAGKVIDDYLMAALYNQHLLHQDESSEKLIGNVSSIVSATKKHSNKAQKDSKQYMNILDEGLLMLDSSKPELSRQVVEKLKKATSYAKKTQQLLIKALEQAQAKANDLQEQMDELNHNRQLDPLTGLYNRSILNQTVDMWVHNKTENIAALAINLDHFRAFNENYGMTIGNVILSKVAQKIKSYVNDTGVPIRMAGEEFLVMIPEADSLAAQEIAEKVRQGVEKLQFINAKNKQRLPRMTVSIGISHYTDQSGIDGTLQKANSALRMAKATGRNRVYIDQ